MLTPADIEFIVSHEGEDVAKLLLGASGKRGKESMNGINIPLCAKCIQAREKMKTKVPLWYNCTSLAYPLSVSVEQGSSQATALFKQKIISNLFKGKGKPITADLTGGMGIDSHFISLIADTHYYFEMNSQLCMATEYNFRELGASNIIVSNTNITTDGYAALKELEKKNISLIYIDPARRGKDGGKTIQLQDYEPNIVEMQEQMFAVSQYVLVKVSPMADIKLNLKLLPKTEKVYVVAVENECKELLFLLNRDANLLGNGAEIHCVEINRHSSAEIAFRTSDEDEAVPNYCSNINKYLYEPYKAILKGGAYKLVCNMFNCSKLAPSTHLYTSNEAIENFPGKKFLVEEVIPFNKKNLRELSARLPKADITARNFPLDTNALKKLSGIKDGGNRHIFATTLHNGERILMVTLNQSIL